jgi:hypothetical protein
MKRKPVPVGQTAPDSSGAGDGGSVPLEVFYVVRTTGDVVGTRRHRICPPLYETRHQAQAKLMKLQAAGSGSDTYSVWKAVTYVEPADWLYDVVIANGSVIRRKAASTGAAVEH